MSFNIVFFYIFSILILFLIKFYFLLFFMRNKLLDIFLSISKKLPHKKHPFNESEN